MRTVTSAIGQQARGFVGNEPIVRRLLRYGILSVATLLFGLGFLVFFLGLLRWPAPVANIIGAGVAVGPLYMLSRRWVSPQEGFGVRDHREVAIIWAVGLLGVAVCTTSARPCDLWTKRCNVAHAEATGLIASTVICSYGIIWVVRFLLIDRFVWPQKNSVGCRRPLREWVGAIDTVPPNDQE